MVAAKEVVSRLKADGWFLSEESVGAILEGNNYNFQQASQELLNNDLKDVGLPCLTEDLVKGKKNNMSGPMVLQVSKVRNVSAPKAFEDSGGAPRMLRLSLTDGTNTIQALETHLIKSLSLKLAPGTKVRLTGKVPVSGGFFLLTASNIAVIGGTVQELYDKWRLSQSIPKYGRSVQAADGSGPPPWVPFGKRIVKDKEEIQQFKALKIATSKEKEDDEFENQRKQAVKELAKEGSLKVFGGGKQMLDANVQKVVNAGFNPEVAEWALRNNKNDPSKAIRELRAAASGQPPPSDYSNQYSGEEVSQSGRRGRGGRGRGRGRSRGGPDDSDDEYFEPPPNMPRPSGPASLFDFVGTKMIEKKETVNFVEPVPDVRGSMYQDYGRGERRGRGMGRGRGRQGRGGYMGRGALNGSVSPPSLSSVEHWPAPGEEKVAPAPNRSYLESKELMEQREYEENISRPSPRYAPPRHQQQQSRYDGRQGNPGRSRGGYDNRNHYSDRGGRGGRWNESENSHGGGRSYSQRGGGRNSRGSEGGQYYEDSYNGRYRESRPSYNNSQGYDSYGGRHDSAGGYGRGSRGGVRTMSEYSNKEREMIQEFQRSINQPQHHQPSYDTQTSHRRYDSGADYASNYVGTMEFHRGRHGGGGGGGRRGRGGYY